MPDREPAAEPAGPGGPVPLHGEQRTPGGMLLGEHDLAGIAAPFASAVFVLPPGAASEPDVHEVLETWFIGSGEGLVEYDGRTLAVRAGDAVHFASGRPHRLRNTGTGEITAFSVWWSA